MNSSVQIKVHPKETTYFVFKILAAIAGYMLLAGLLVGFTQLPEKAPYAVLVFYAVAIIIYLFLRLGLMVGYLKGNGIKVSEKQFPDVYRIVKKQCERLNMQVPDIYILQQGGLLNAFAAQFLGGKYVVLYSDVLEEAYAGNIEAVEFVVGHELGHIKRNHLTKRFVLWPSLLVPFLGSAYSRACEYTCDNIGAALNPAGAGQGLLLLAAGKQLWRKVDREVFSAQMETEGGFWHWFSEKMSSHPHLSKRLKRFPQAVIKTVVNRPMPETIQADKATIDHSAYLPKN